MSGSQREKRIRFAIARSAYSIPEALRLDDIATARETARSGRRLLEQS